MPSTREQRQAALDAADATESAMVRARERRNRLRDQLVAAENAYTAARVAHEAASAKCRRLYEEMRGLPAAPGADAPQPKGATPC